jgi:hypothetical protein
MLTLVRVAAETVAFLAALGGIYALLIIIAAATGSL